MTSHQRRSVLRDAITPRAFLLVLGVLALQLGFILSYVGAFHDPTPDEIDLAVVAPTAQAAQQAADQLNGIDGAPLDATVAESEDEAKQQIRDRDVYGALVVGSGTRDELLVASAEGGAVSDALIQVVRSADASQDRTVEVTDYVPAGKADARGLSAFYLAVGWVVGGYLVSAILGISAGERPANLTRAGIRLGALGLYSVVSGIAGAMIFHGLVNEGSGGGLWELSLLGMLVVFAVGAFTMGIQTLTGIVGIGIAVLLFVVLGNPSAGGAYPAPLLPPFWQAIGWLLPPGAGTDAIRGIVYFDNAKVLTPAIVLAVWAVVGTVMTLVVSGLKSEDRARP